MNSSKLETSIDTISHCMTPQESADSQVSPTSRGRLLTRIDPWSLASIAVLTFCLWMAWQPKAHTSAISTSQASSASSVEPAVRAIIDYRVGDAVLADESRGDHDTSLGLTVDPPTWKHLVLKASKTDGTTADVEFLRPDWWLKEHQAQVGRTIEISVPECGIEGQAEVLAINNCPDLQPTPRGYRTVTGTFRHESTEVIDIHVEGLDEPIGTTAVHPFWSEDRQEYVQAGDLIVGEHLLGDTGKIEITSISTRGSPEPVYNLEVLGDHNYHVTGETLLVHNNCPQPRGRDGKFLPYPSGNGRRTPPGKRGEELVQSITGHGKNGSRFDVPLTSRQRIPDQVYTDSRGTKHFVDVKDISGTASYTQQIRDTAKAADANDAVYDIYIPQGTKISGPLQDAYDDGIVNIFYFWEE